MIAYSESLEETEDTTNTQTILDEFEAGLQSDFKTLIAAIGFTFSVNVGYMGSREVSSSSTSSSIKARTRSFALGDADDGDYFDVQVRVLLAYLT
jgi:hypothetical protein